MADDAWTVAAERIGRDYSIRILRTGVSDLRPAHLRPTLLHARRISRASWRSDFWSPEVSMPVGFGQTRSPMQLAVLVMVSGQSRWLSGSGVGLAGGWGPVRWVVDAARAAKRYSQGWSSDGGASRRRGRDSADLTGDCQAFRGTLDAKVIVCRPADPEAKGLTERASGYLETSFLPGHTFDGPDDFNAQLAGWLPKANAAGCGCWARRQTIGVEADRAALLTLPPVAPMTGVAALAAAVPGPTITSGVVSNDYSVHPTAVGRRIEIVAGLDPARCSAGAQWWLTIPGARGPSPVDCRHCPCPSRDCAAARPVHRGRQPAATEVEQRSAAAPAGDAAPLTGYDSAFRMGLDQGMGGGLMPTRTQATPVKDLMAEVAYLTRALKAPPARIGGPARRTGPAQSRGRMRRTWSPAWNVGSPPPTPMTTKAG